MKKLLFITSIFSLTFKLFAIEANLPEENKIAYFDETPHKSGVYPVKSIEVMYFDHHKENIPYPKLMQTKVCLTKEDNVFTYDENKSCMQRRLSEFVGLREPEYFDKKALKEISKSLVQYFNKKGIHGVQVKVCYKQISDSGTDLRSSDDLSLKFVVKTAKVGKISTAAHTKDKEIQKNLKQHRRFIKKAPIKPSDKEYGQKGSLFYKDRLDDYLFYLNRHPSRRVDINIRPLMEDEIGLEFLVREAKPWFLWFNVANTGTYHTAGEHGTKEWIETIGFAHNQLSNNDDIFRAMYSTDSFQTVHAAYLTYEAPLYWPDKSRWGLSAGYNRFIATELGVFTSLFKGEQWPVSGKLVFLIYQYQNFFVDLIPSLEFRHIYVKNPVTGITHGRSRGRQNFLFPQLALEMQKTVPEYRFFFNFSGNMTPNAELGEDRDQLDLLGRNNISKKWWFLAGDTVFAFYVDPLFLHASKVEPPLINELSFRFRGQWSFNWRLIPQIKPIIGGFNTVRGYPESILSGDNFYVFNAEYLLHIPRLLPPSKTTNKKVWGKDFYMKPKYRGGPTDWDLIFRGFLDVGRVTNNKQVAFEFNQTIIGAGVGLEFIFSDFLYARWDMGFRGTSVEELNLKSGDARHHGTITFVF